MLDKLIWYYKISKKISSNKDKLFIYNYWKILILLLKMRLRLSIIYYFKIDK